jgi:hypothetical protein
MTGSAEAERKVRQLGNEVDSIYEILGDVQETLNKHGRLLESMFQRMEAWQEVTDTKLDRIDTRFDPTHIKLDAILGAVRPRRPHD